MKNSIKTADAQDKKQHLYYIDVLNILACFGVICLHCSGGVFNFENTKLWYIYMAVQTVAHFAVPVFFMITGATLLGYRKKYDTKTYFKKRVIKTFVPFLFWTLVYYFYPYIAGTAETSPTLQSLADAVFNNQANYIFWFFYVIFAIYISIPVFSLIAEKKNIKIFEYICIIGFCANAVYPLVTRFVMPVYSGIIPGMVGGYIEYIFLGWLIKNKDYTLKQRVFVYASGVAGALIMFFGTYFLNIPGESLDPFLMGYDSIACFPMSAAVFMAAKYIKWEKMFKVIPKKIITTLPTASLGIYLIHMLVLNAFAENEWLKIHPVYFTLLMPFAIYIICLAITLILKKIPGVKHLIP